MALVPFTFSLFYGVFFGLCMYLVFKVFSGSFWRKYAPPFVVTLALDTWDLLCCQKRKRGTGGDGLYSSLREDVRRNREEDDENLTEPLYFDNPTFDFDPVSERSRAISDASSEFFGGVSYKGIGLVPMPNSSGKDYLDIYDADLPDGEQPITGLSGSLGSEKSQDWYMGVPLQDDV